MASSKKTTKFPWAEWFWTEEGESLFDLTPEEYGMFKLFVACATCRAGQKEEDQL